MKKQTLILAAILLVAVTSFVSCQKEETSAVSNLNKSHKSFYQPPKVDDMNAYLRDFKLKMQTRGNDDTMDIEEAAWHLSSVANYDFGDVVGDFSKFHYDTLYYNINIENDKVAVSDLNTLYTGAFNDINLCFQNLDLDNKHIRFIDAEITENGSVIMSILVSYDWIDHQWYFPDPITLDSVYSLYFDDNTAYTVTGTFPTTLKYALNDLTSHHPNLLPSQSIYYIRVREQTFLYTNYTDPYDSPFYGDSRIYARQVPGTYVSSDDGHYCLDSYIGLAVDNLYYDEVIIDWVEIAVEHTFGGSPITYQKPKVRYGIPVIATPVTPPVD